MKKQVYTSLVLDELKLPINLGCTTEERKDSQYVFVDLVLRFSSMPDACINDELADTICYAKLISQIKDFCKEREFKLIEYFAAELFGLLKAILPKHLDVSVKVKKPAIISDLKSSIFTIGDF